MMNLMIYFRRLGGFNRNSKLFLLSTLLNGLGLSLFVLLYNLYILSVGLHQDMIGELTAIASLVAVGAALPVGWLANRIGYKPALFWGIVGSAFSVVLPLLLPSAEMFIACELIWGVTFTMFTVVGSPFISENATEAERPYLFSLQFVLTMLTTFVGCLIGGGLPRLVGQWVGAAPESPSAYQGALWIGTALLFLSAAPVLFLAEPRRRHAYAVPPRFSLRDRGRGTRLVLPGVIAAVGGGMFVPFVAVMWKVSHGLDDAAIGQVLAVSGLLMSILGVAAPMLSRRWGLVRVNVWTLVLSALGLVTFGFSPFFVLALVGYLGRDVLVNVSRPLTQQFQMEHSRHDERAAVSSLFTMGVNVAWGIGSWVSGIWQTQGWYGLVFVVSAGSYLVSALAWSKLFRDSPAGQPDPADEGVAEAEIGPIAAPVGAAAE